VTENQKLSDLKILIETRFMNLLELADLEYNLKVVKKVHQMTEAFDSKNSKNNNELQKCTHDP